MERSWRWSGEKMWSRPCLSFSGVDNIYEKTPAAVRVRLKIRTVRGFIGVSDIFAKNCATDTAQITIVAAPGVK